MPAEGQQKRPTVFISYAHESDALRASVKALADWLGNRDCTVLTDHLYVDRPPKEGWPMWMRNCVQEADIVLIVCTPMLKARYEKNEEPGKGLGATFEGANVTQHIYDAAMQNEKFFPILPDGGNINDVPILLRSWWNGHSFPSGYERIRRMIFHEPPSADERSTRTQEFTTVSMNRNVETNEKINAPVFREVTDSHFYYSDQHIWIDAILPNIERYVGSCAIGLKQTGLDDCIITLTHQGILSKLFHGHHSGIDVEKRRIIAFGPSKELNKYAIDIGNARLFLSEVVVRSVCSAIDALHEAYVEALKKIDLAWEAEGFSYENHGSEVVVYLGTLSAWMWSGIVEFGREHDYEHGDSEWHMFDANDMSLVIYSPIPTRRFDKGMHVHVSATHQSPASTSTADTITLLWNPPSRYRREIYPLSERRYWGAATTFRCINEELIPKIYDWRWSNEPRTVRSSPRAEQHKTELYSRLKDYGMLVNYERQRRQSMDLHGSLSDLQRLVATLQEEFHGASDTEYILKKEMMSNLYHAIILCLPHVDPENLDYVARKLDLPDVQDKEQLIEELKEKIKQDDFPCNLYPVELALRSLLFLLKSPGVFLNTQEMKQIAYYLNPLIEIYREVDMRRRHGLK